MKTISLLTLAAALLIACGFTSARAQNTNDAVAGPGAGHERLWQRLGARLELTDAQKAQLKTIWSGEKGNVKSLIGRLHAARKNLRAAIHAGDANETTVRAAAAKVAAVEADLAVERMKLYSQIAPILTDEQRRKIAGFEQRLDGAIGRAARRLDDGQDH